jgi:hypothetical protein
MNLRNITGDDGNRYAAGDFWIIAGTRKPLTINAHSEHKLTHSSNRADVWGDSLDCKFGGLFLLSEGSERYGNSAVAMRRTQLRWHTGFSAACWSEASVEVIPARSEGQYLQI